MVLRLTLVAGLGETTINGQLTVNDGDFTNGWIRMRAIAANSPQIDLQSAYILRSASGGLLLGETVGGVDVKVTVVGNFLVNGDDNRIQLGNGDATGEIVTNLGDATTLTMRNRNAAGTFALDVEGDVSAEDLTLTGDINLSDGSTIEIGGGTGETTINGDLDISGGSSTLKTGYGQSGLKAFSGLSGTITPDGGVAMAFVGYFGNTGAYFATNNSGQFKIYNATLNGEAGFDGKQWAATGFKATDAGTTFQPAFELDGTSGDEGGFYLSGTDQVWCSDRTDRVKLKRTGELEVLFDLDVSGDISLTGHTSLSTTLSTLDTATTTNASDLSTHTSDTSIHYADAPSDGSQYARQNGAWSVVSGGGGGASSGDSTDITGLLRGNGSTLSAASASQIRSDAGLDTTDSPTFAGLAIENTSTADSLLLTTTEDSADAAPVLTFKRNSSTILSGDYLGQLKFKGENDADQEVVYAKITGKISDETDGSEDGLIEFMLSKNGANNIGARLTSTDLKLINGTGLEVDGDVTVSGNILSDSTISLAPSGTDPGTDALQVFHSGDYFSLNALGNGLYFRTNNAVRGTLTETGTLQWRHDILGYDTTQNLGNSTTGRFDTFYGDSVDLTGDITLADGATIDVGGGTGTLTVDVDEVDINGDVIIGAALNNSHLYFSDNKAHYIEHFVGGLRIVGNHHAGIHVTNGKTEILSDNVTLSGSLPTSDPAVAGRLWNDSGTLKVSAG